MANANLGAVGVPENLPQLVNDLDNYQKKLDAEKKTKNRRYIIDSLNTIIALVRRKIDKKRKEKGIDTPPEGGGGGNNNEGKKINPMLLIGAAAVAYLLLTKRSK
jgi:hypothetical protein